MDQALRFIPSDDYAGGWLQGEFTASYSDLVKVFGEPSDGDGYKVSTSWTIQDTETGAVFEIYDYKETSLYDPSNNPSVEEFRALDSYDWHIGGERACDRGALRTFVSERLRALSLH